MWYVHKITLYSRIYSISYNIHVTFSEKISDKNGQTHIEMFEMSNFHVSPFSKKRARNSYYAKLMTLFLPRKDIRRN